MIADKQGQTWRVHFQSLFYDGRSVEMVQSVELPAFGGGTAFYTFGYTQATIPRAYPHNDPTLGTTVSIQLLTSVALPNGSSYQMPDYTTEACTDTACRKSGAIRALRLPTLGRLEWSWQDYIFPSHTKRPWRRRSAGVATRTTYASMSATEGGSTTTTLSCFNAATGFLERKRTLKNSGTAESANDVLEVYPPDALGNVAQERFFGGDQQALTANGTTCAMALPAAVYQIDHIHPRKNQQTGIWEQVRSSEHAGAGFTSTPGGTGESRSATRR